MILNLHFDKCESNKLSFDAPYIMLEKQCSYEIGLRHFYLELLSNQITKDNELWALSTNLVDRSPTNTFQTISYFNTSKGKLHQSFIPGSVVFYPLEVHHLENPQFLIQRINRSKILQIDHAYIQLEIKRVCLDSVKV